jgi:hypothetical protein
MYAHGNDIHVKNAKTNLVAMDSKVVVAFTTMCKSSGQDNSPIKADLEYVGWVVLFCIG